MAQKRTFSSLGGEAVRTPDRSGHVAKKPKPNVKKAHRRRAGADDTPRHFPTKTAAPPEMIQKLSTPAATAKVAIQNPARAAPSVEQPAPLLSAAELPEPPPGLTKKARKNWRKRLRLSLSSGQGLQALPAVDSTTLGPQAEPQSAPTPVAPTASAARVHATPQRRAEKPGLQLQHLEAKSQKAERPENDLLRRASTTQLVATPRKLWNAAAEPSVRQHDVKPFKGVDRACQTDIHGRLHLKIVFEEPASRIPQLVEGTAAPIVQLALEESPTEASLAQLEDDVSMSDAESEASETFELKQIERPPSHVKAKDEIVEAEAEDDERIESDKGDRSNGVDEGEESRQSDSSAEASGDVQALLAEDKAAANKTLKIKPPESTAHSATATDGRKETQDHEIIEISSGSESSSEYVSSDDEAPASKAQPTTIAQPKTAPPAARPQAPSSAAKFTSKSLLDRPPFSLIPDFGQRDLEDDPQSATVENASRPIPTKSVTQHVKPRDDSPSSTHSSLFAGINKASTVARPGTQGFGPIVKSASAQKVDAARKAATNKDTRSAFDRFSSFVGGDESSDESDSESESDGEKNANPSSSKKIERTSATDRVKIAGISTPAKPVLPVPAQKAITGSIRETNNARASQQLEQEAGAVSQDPSPVPVAGGAAEKEVEEDDSASSSDDDDESEQDDQKDDAESSESESEDNDEESAIPPAPEHLQTLTNIEQDHVDLRPSADVEASEDSDSEASEDENDDEHNDDPKSEAHRADPTKYVAAASASKAVPGRAAPLSSRVEVPASQEDEDAAALLDGYSEDEEDTAEVQPGPSRTPTTSAATSSRQEQPDSRTSISAFSEHLDSTKKDGKSFLGQRLGGIGSRQAPNSELPDADTPSKQLTFAASEDGDDIYDTIDEVTRGVFNSTRALPPLDNMGKSDSPVKSTVRRRLAKDVYIPRAPQDVIACYTARVFDDPTPDAPQTEVIHDSLPLPDRTNAKDLKSAMAIGKPSLPNGESSSSLSDLGVTPSPPASPIVRDFVRDPVLPGNDAYVQPEPKKRRKMTGSTSKHFSPEKRTKREREREDENNQLFSDMLADDPTGFGEKRESTDRQTPIKPAPKKKRKTTGKKSDHFLPTHLLDRVDLPSPSKGQGRPPAGVSRAPIPPITSDRFGIIQEKLWEEPFWLLIATIFLNQTTGRAAVPVFWAVKARYGSPELLAKAEFEEVLFMIAKLGLQNQRAKRLIKIAETWVAQPPLAGTRFKTENYPEVSDHIPYNRRKVKAIEEDASECKGALEIGHLPGLGPYGWDSWRIFCRDVLRGVAEDYNGQGAADGFQPEWQRVVPLDKELRATLRWMWLREGYIWDHSTGEKRRANEEEMELALKGEMDVGDEKEKVFAARAAGMDVAETPKEEAQDERGIV